MANTVRGIFLLILKWLLAVVLCIVAVVLAFICIASAYNYLTYTRYADKVQITVLVSKKNCASGYPLFVAIGNQSSKTIQRITFRLDARRKGYSNNLSNYESYTDDKIIPPNTVYGTCWRAPLPQTAKDDPAELEWKVGYLKFDFE